jgi:hypothetical protein
MKTLVATDLKATFCLLAFGLATTGSLSAAELSADFPKPPIPFELAPRMGCPFNDNAVLQQKVPGPAWGWTLPSAAFGVTFDQ